MTNQLLQHNNLIIGYQNYAHQSLTNEKIITEQIEFYFLFK